MTLVDVANLNDINKLEKNYYISLEGLHRFDTSLIIIILSSDKRKVIFTEISTNAEQFKTEQELYF